MGANKIRIDAPPVVVVWQDPRDRVCVAVKDGQPISLSRTEARDLSETIERAANLARERVAQGILTCFHVAVEPRIRTGVDTRQRGVDKDGNPRHIPLVTLEVRGETAICRTAAAAAIASKIARYAARPYVRKTATHDGV